MRRPVLSFLLASAIAGCVTTSQRADEREAEGSPDAGAGGEVSTRIDPNASPAEAPKDAPRPKAEAPGQPMGDRTAAVTATANTLSRTSYAVATCSGAGKSNGGLSVFPNSMAGFGTAPLNVPDSADLAAQRSRKDLRDRICGDLPCHEVESKMQLVHSGPVETQPPQFCAMTLVGEPVVSAHFKAIKGMPLDEQLARVVEALYAFFEAKKRTGEVTVDKIIDHGHPGTPRSNLLKDRFAGALYNRQKVLIGSVPKGWSGEKLPPGFAAVLNAKITSASGDPNRLVVTWSALVHGPRNTQRTLPLPELAVFAAELPTGPVAGGSNDFSDWPQDPSLKLRIDAAPGGSLCSGETSQLTAHSTRARFLQVYSLFADGRAMLVYPRGDLTETERVGRVPARVDVPLGGPDGFQAQPLKGENEELFLVLGADEPNGFAQTASWKGPCMVPPQVARKLWKPKTLPASLVKSTEGYQIVSGARCDGIEPLPPVDVEELVRVWPTCQ